MIAASLHPPANSRWSRQQDKAFENALIVYDEDCEDRWEKIAAEVPGKNATEIRLHYECLVEDIGCIDAGLVPLPCYISPAGGVAADQTVGTCGTKKVERRKGIAWSAEEHRLFLLGLDEFGKGAWRSISRNFVVSRTPTQVASHAQKYFNRQNSMNKDRRRSSIHDTTR